VRAGFALLRFDVELRGPVVLLPHRQHARHRKVGVHVPRRERETTGLSWCTGKEGWAMQQERLKEFFFVHLVSFAILKAAA